MRKLPIVLVVVSIAGLSCDGRTKTERRLCDAIALGDVAYLRTHLHSNEVNTPLHYTHAARWFAPPIHIAIAHGQTPTVRFLISLGSDVNQRDSQGETPLAWAIGRISNNVALTNQ